MILVDWRSWKVQMTVPECFQYWQTLFATATLKRHKTKPNQTIAQKPKANLPEAVCFRLQGSWAPKHLPPLSFVCPKNRLRLMLILHTTHCSLTCSETHSLLSKSNPSALTSVTRFGGGHEQAAIGQCDADRGQSPLHRKASKWKPYYKPNRYSLRSLLLIPGVICTT